MAFRVVMIENDMKINLRLDNLVFIRGDEETTIPLVDISAIVIDNLKVSVTTRTLCRLAEHNIILIMCDQHHLPIGMYSAYDSHSRMSKAIRFQIGRNENFNAYLWRDIIYSKIKNQMKHLRMRGADGETIDLLSAYMSDIHLADATNREAHAAKVYFNELMGTSFSRGNDDLIINSGLDFGYAIVRSYIARACVGYGLNTQIGIHHKNEYNRFNLVDDLIEPFRPIVDMMVLKIMGDSEFFTLEHRRLLVDMLNHKLFYRGKKMHISSVIEEYVSSMARFIIEDNYRIVYPDIDDYLGREEENEV